MAGEVRTIRVSGLPQDLSENRLIDKLKIHFLRKKNSGGEISSVTVSRTIPGTAFITFEDIEVASRLAQTGKQDFKVNEKSYDITISLHHDEVDADKVLTSMSVMVDYRNLPGGKNTVLSLHKRFPGVRLIFDAQKDVYSLSGLYSQVQPLSSLIVGALDKEDQGSGDKPQIKKGNSTTFNSPLEEPSNNNLGVNEDSRLIKQTSLSEDSYEDHASESWKSDLHLQSSHSDHTSHAALMEDKWDSLSDFGMSFENFSLIVDTDIFHYLQKYCAKEYHGILKHHSVEVLDVNCEDITTLYLKPNTASSDHSISCVQKAQQDLARLYQQKESQLRKEHVYKSGIPPKELTLALRSLREKFPKLMIHEEDRNVYMVGSKSDVSEAKQFLFGLKGFRMEKEVRSDHSKAFVSSQSLFKSSKQGSSASSTVSCSLPPVLQDLPDLFMPRKDHQDTKHREIFSENSSKGTHSPAEPKLFDDAWTPSGQFTSTQRIENLTEDIFSLRRTVSQETSVPNDLEGKQDINSLSKNKYPDSLFNSMPSDPHLVLDINKKSFNNTDTSELQSHSDTAGSETAIRSNKGYKSKQTESGKEWKMAANFSGERCGSLKNLTSDDSEAPKLNEVVFVEERMLTDHGQLHSFPLFQPSRNSNVDYSIFQTNNKPGPTHSDIPHNKKPIITPVSLNEDQHGKHSPTMTPGPTLRRSNSFSDKIKTVKGATQMPVDYFAQHKRINQQVETREIVAMELTVSFKLWLYLRSIYNTEIENLTSDLQVKEELGKEHIKLCLKGVGSEKVSECHDGLKSLIATVELDFDEKTLPLPMLGVSNSKDETLLKFCTSMKQRYKMVKILVVSKDMMLLGPKPLCEEVEAATMKIFLQKGNITNLDLENKTCLNPDSLHTNKDPNSELKPVQSTTSEKTHITSKMSDQSVSHSFKTVHQDFIDQTSDSQEQYNGSGNQDKIKDEKLEQWDKNDPTSAQSTDGTKSNKNGEPSSYIVNTTTKDKADGDDKRHPTTTAAQSTDTVTEQTNPDVSVDRIKDSRGSSEEPKDDILPSHADGNQNLLLCDMCKNEYSNVRQVADGVNLCAGCEKAADANLGIKGTMTIQESTITIPGFNRDTALKIVYDIPDGIQGEDHPFPGLPFKGNRFVAFLPNNSITQNLLPLLKKAFDEGLTFTVKVDENSEGRVVWGPIPHKTKTEGGLSQNGYPDFNYIKHLEEALKIAGITK